MRKSTFLTVFIFMMVLGAYCQNVYYWTNGTKTYLTPSKNKQYVLMDASDTLDFKNNVSDCYSHTVILNPLILSDSSFARGNLFWSVVNLCDTVEIKNLKSFVYNAPFFITQNHNEVGLVTPLLCKAK